MAITREQIFKAADIIQEQGQAPTLAAVRKHLGGGSFSTISEWMNEWRNLRARIEPPREPVPKAIIDRLLGFGDDLWATALEVAQQRFQAEREALEAQRAEMEQRLNEAAALADQTSEELESCKGKLTAAIQQADERVALASREAVEAREAAAVMRGQLEALERQNKALLDKLAGPGESRAEIPVRKARAVRG
jgi:hypothetical protein